MSAHKLDKDCIKKFMERERSQQKQAQQRRRKKNIKYE